MSLPPIPPCLPPTLLGCHSSGVLSALFYVAVSH